MSGHRLGKTGASTAGVKTEQEAIREVNKRSGPEHDEAFSRVQQLQVPWRWERLAVEAGADDADVAAESDAYVVVEADADGDGPPVFKSLAGESSSSASASASLATSASWAPASAANRSPPPGNLQLFYSCKCVIMSRARLPFALTASFFVMEYKNLVYE